MTNHTDLLNFIAVKIKAASYLEIGVFNPSHNFDLIAVADKVSVDPDPKAGAIVKMTSDKYFETFDKKFDLVFIDGLHHADQVRRDIINSWQHLNEGGVIVLHDCNPPTEATTCVPRGGQREWCGDTWKAAIEIKEKFTVDFDYGCTAVRKVEIEPMDISWQEFEERRGELLCLVTIEHAKTIIASW